MQYKQIQRKNNNLNKKNIVFIFLMSVVCNLFIVICMGFNAIISTFQAISKEVSLLRIYLVWGYLQLCLGKYYLSGLVVLTTLSCQILFIWFGGTYNYVLPNIIYLVWWYLQLCLAKYYLSSLVVLTTMSCQVLFIWFGATSPLFMAIMSLYVSTVTGNNKITEDQTISKLIIIKPEDETYTEIKKSSAFTT